MSSATKAGAALESKSSTPVVPASTFSSARSLLLQRKCACNGGNPAECESCKKKEAEEQQKAHTQRLQKSSSGPSRSASAPPIVNRVLNSPGRALDAGTRSFMEPRFGRDFSAVRVHTDSQASESARAVDAHAYTVGQNIVFDHGKYDPHSGGGRQLLAHELAHTVQQHGLQRSSDNLSLGESSEYHHLEREAESIARSVTAGRGAQGTPTLTTRPSQMMISRVGKSTSDAEEGEREWVKPDVDLSRVKNLKKVAWPGKEVKKGVATFNLGTLPLPAEKGPVLGVWKPIAKAKQLQAIVEGSSSPFIALKQDRPSPASLRNIWREKLGWTADDARAKWKNAAKKSKAVTDDTKATWGSPPKVEGSECQVDHILELQFGGSSDRENLQMLDGDANMKAGGDLYTTLRGQYDDIRDALDKSSRTNVKTVVLLFDDVDQPKKLCGPCCKLEQWAADKGNEAVEGESIKGPDKSGQTYPIKIGNFPPTSLIITQEYDDPKVPMPIRKSTVPENRSAATLISGMLLDTLSRKGGAGKHVIDAAQGQQFANHPAEGGRSFAARGEGWNPYARHQEPQSSLPLSVPERWHNKRAQRERRWLLKRWRDYQVIDCFSSGASLQI